MKKFISIFLVLLLSISILVACQGKPQEEGNKGGEEPEAITLKDSLGNEVKVPENIESIISMGPSITEVLVELGLADKIIAVDTYSGYIEGIDSDLATIEMMSPDVEKIIELDADLILSTTMIMVEGEDPLAQLRQGDTALAYIQTSESIEGIYDDIEFISQVVNKEEEGKSIVEKMKKEIEEYKAIGDTITDKKTVYFEIGESPGLYSFGKGNFLNEMIALLGAENILADQDGWITTSEEAVIAENPDVILTNVSYIEDAVGQIKERKGWENVEAIKNDAVYYIDDNNSSQPNHNIIKALEEMAKAIYPDKY